MPHAILGPIAQIGYLVADLDGAVAEWAGTLGVGPWTVFRNVVMTGTYDGAPTEVTMDVALGYQGHVQIELIAPLGHASSPYRGPDGDVLLGMHHLGWLVDDLAAAETALVGRGLETRFAAANESTRVAYLAPRGQAGVLFELIESPATAALIEQGIADTARWDGRALIAAEHDFAVMAG